MDGDEGVVRELERLAVRLRVAREEVEAGRTALGRFALVWWAGTAADRYAALVDERRARLAALADELRRLEEQALTLVVAARAEAGRALVGPEAS